MRLDADEIYLRVPEPRDVDTLVAAVAESAATVGRWLPWAESYGSDEARAFVGRSSAAVADRSAFDLLVFDATNDEILGGCGLNRLDETFRIANLGYWTRETRRGRGVAVTAGRRIARFGFDELDRVRIEIVAAVDNTPSQRVAEKLGGVREGVLRNRLMDAGRPVDGVMFSLIPGDLA